MMARVEELQKDRINRLVFSDALALFVGEGIRDIAGSSHHSVITDLVTGPTRQERYDLFIQNVPEELASWAADRPTQHPIGCFREPMILENSGTKIGKRAGSVSSPSPRGWVSESCV